MHIRRCVFVYSLAIQNIFNSFQDIRERGNRLVAVEDIQRSGIFKPTLQEQPLLGFLGEVRVYPSLSHTHTHTYTLSLSSSHTHSH